MERKLRESHTMKGPETFRGCHRALLCGIFRWLVAAVFGFHALRIVREEYIAPHRWPVASGEVISAEEKSRRYPGTSSSSTGYFTRFTVEFDPPLDPRAPGMLLTIVGGPTRGTGALDTLEGSSDSAYFYGAIRQDRRLASTTSLAARGCVLRARSQPTSIRGKRSSSRL